MATTYVDLDTASGNDVDSGLTWALAKLTIQAGLTAAGAGGTCFVRRTNAGTPGTDTAAGAGRTLTSAGTERNTAKLVGVKDGTTAEPPVSSDIAVRGVDTLPLFEITGAGYDMTLVGALDVVGCKFITPDRLTVAGEAYEWVFTGSELSVTGVVQISDGALTLINSELEAASTSFQFWTREAFKAFAFQMYGGTLTFTANPSPLFHSTLSDTGALFQGVDLSGFGNNSICGTSNQGLFKFLNCSMPTTYSLSTGSPIYRNLKIEVINSSDVSTLSATASIQDYNSLTAYGTVEAEATVVRTGGADDGALGLFSYAIKPIINTTVEGTSAALTSPWMNVWLAGGSNTLTVYICNNDSTPTDFNEDEVWVEFYTPDAGDTAQHDQTFFPASARLLDSSTAITDDTGSTWGGTNYSHQKLSMTVTTGFEGWGYARLHYAKRFASGATTLYLDPKIEIT